MAQVNSHPAHRNPKEAAPADTDSLAPIIRELAEVPMTCETPGVHADELTDQLIGIARRWIEREDRSNRFSAELG